MAHTIPDPVSMRDNNRTLVAMLVEDHRRHDRITDGLAGLQFFCAQQFSDAQAVLRSNHPDLLAGYSLRMGRIERLFEGLAGSGQAEEREIRVRRAELIFDLQRLFCDLDEDLFG